MLHEKLQPTIRASSLPANQPLATDDDQPGEQQFHTLAVQEDVSFQQHSPHFATPSCPRYSSSDVRTGTGGTSYQSLNASNERPPSIPEPSTTIQEPQWSDLIPIIPADVKRYERNIRMKWAEPKRLVIAPQDNIKFSVESVQDGWCGLVHPEGPMIYYHPQRRIFTDADMRPGRVNSQILLSKVEVLMANAMRVSANINEETELVLEVNVGPEYTILSCGYYFVDHATRMIFWAHPYTCEPDGEILFNIKAARRHSHIKYSFEAQYWHHCELYPHKRYLSRGVFEELKEIIIHATAETITSDTSLAPFDGDELTQMLNLMDCIEGSIDKRHAHSMCVVARFMRLFTRVRYMNFCGQPGARVDADKSIYFKKGHNRQTLIFRLANILLWSAPRNHYKRIQRVWVDEIINAPRWKDFITQRDNEWMNFTLFSTVMLAVDIGFLAVPGITDPERSSQITPNLAVYMSTLCSASSLVVSVILLGQGQDYNLQTADGGAAYMSHATGTITGVENLALTYSLPFALLIWAMVFFGLALSAFIFTTSSGAALAAIGPGWTIVVVFTLWPTIHPTRWLLDLVTILARQPKRVVRYMLGTWSGGSRPDMYDA